MKPSANQPVGFPEAAHLMGITEGEVRRAHAMGRFVTPRWTVNGDHAWRWADVERWASQTRPPLPIVSRYRERTSA